MFICVPIVKFILKFLGKQEVLIFFIPVPNILRHKLHKRDLKMCVFVFLERLMVPFSSSETHKMYMNGRMAGRKQKMENGKREDNYFKSRFSFSYLQCLDVLSKYAKEKEAEHKSSPY